MANILDILNTISNAQYGREVRQAIVDGISQCYADGKAGVNDLQARQLIESAIAVNEDQQTELMNLLSRIEELEGGGSGEGTTESTTIEVPSFIVDSGIVENITIESSGTNNRTITFSKEFTEIPAVSCVVMVQQTATANYADVQVIVIKSSISTTGFKFTVANRSGSQRSATIGWLAIQPTTETIPLDITIPEAEGMSEQEVRAITNPIQTSLDSVKTGWDGTVYNTPGEAVRQQITDLHVLIGDEPGTGIDASAVSYGEDSVEDALDGLNERLGDLTQLNTENKTNLVDAINEAAQTGSSEEFVRHLPTLKIYGDISVMTAEKNEPKIYQYIWEDPDNKEQRTGYCSMKWQGESSLTYPKKNYTIKFFHDANYRRKDKLSLFADLVLKKNKWVIKANWVDRSMAKNIVSCRIWKQLVKSRNAEPEAHLKETPNYGAVNGHPIQVYVNDVWHGLYTFNIPKDEDLFGMEEDNPLHCAVCGDSQSGTGSTAFRIATTSGWELEVPDAWASYEVEEDGQTITKYVADGLVALINFVMTATDAEFKENLNNYLDVESAIDYYLMTYLDCGVDSLGRNLMLLTYDGGNKWYCSLYDADTTWGNGVMGAGTYNPTLPCPEGYQMKTSLLWERLEANFGDELYERWKALRQNIFRADYIKNQFTYFWEDITEELYNADIERWRAQDSQNPNVPQWNIDVQKAIFNFIDARLPYCDAQIKAMRTPVPCTGIALNESSIRFTNGSPIALVATLEPENTTDEVVWTSSDNTVVTVNNGVVYPLKNGTATITATCGNQTATCAVTVVGLSFEISLVGGHATLSNTDVIAPNASYTGTLTADTGFEFTSVIVTMGGTDITATAYSDGIISIAQVTGDIVVTVETAYHYDETDLIYKLGSAFTLNGTNYIDTGFLYDSVSPLTIAIDFTQPDDMSTSGLYLFGAKRANGGNAVWEASYRGTKGIHSTNQTSGLPATARLRSKAVLRYDPVRKVMSTRSSCPDTITSNIVEKTSSYSHVTINSTRPDRDAFTTSMYLGGIHGTEGLESASETGTIHDMRIYSRRWTDAEVKQWLGVDSLSTVFTDDMDQ